MTISYQLSANDYLQHQLYTASKSEGIKKKRFKSRITIPLIYGAFIAFYLYSKDIQGAIIFFILAALWFFLYPFWDKRRYIKHYESFIKENYKERFKETVLIELSTDFILEKGRASRGIIATSEIEEINEISSSIFIKLKHGVSLILPKNAIENIDSLILFLKELANNLNVKYNIENNWEWK
ncbi:hypothetical protein [Flavobacterium mesophilum]|uniref:hypothetical protein n=1 Tax=Flavobacterium mesophilum TaxID=3143495 RepID=UPI0031E1C744